MINTREQVIEQYKELYPEGKLDKLIIELIEQKSKLLGKNFEDFEYTLFGPEGYMDFYPDGTPIWPGIIRPTVTVRAERVENNTPVGFKIGIDDFIE